MSVRDLTLGWPGAEPLLGGLSFEVAAGERSAIVGPSGVGKTTLAATLLGLIPSAGGGVETRGRDQGLRSGRPHLLHLGRRERDDRGQDRRPSSRRGGAGARPARRRPPIVPSGSWGRHRRRGGVAGWRCRAWWWAITRSSCSMSPPSIWTPRRLPPAGRHLGPGGRLSAAGDHARSRCPFPLRPRVGTGLSAALDLRKAIGANSATPFATFGPRIMFR